jgi:hypothetical protein
MLMIILYFSSLAIAGGKVEICHSPPGNPGLWHTITVPQNAVSDHLAHGDREGPCVSGCADAAECDDGNWCTTDNCEYGECIHAPVECDDGNPITLDYCDPNSGCDYIPDCPEYATWDPETGTCMACPEPFLSYADAVLGLISVSAVEQTCIAFCRFQLFQTSDQQIAYTSINDGCPYDTTTEPYHHGYWEIVAVKFYEDGRVAGAYNTSIYFGGQRPYDDYFSGTYPYAYAELEACQQWVKDKFQEITGSPCTDQSPSP